MVRAKGPTMRIGSNRIRRLIGLALLAAAAVLLIAPAAAADDPRAETLDRLAQRVTAEFDDARLEDVVQFIETIGDIEIDPLWLDDRETSGLDRDREVSASVTEVPLLVLLERVLRDASDAFDRATWQLTPGGVVEVGPRTRLNESATLRIYDINDLIFEIPNYDNVPQLDLDQALQQGGGGGGGGGGGLFEDEDDEFDRPSRRELAEQVIDIILEVVEPEQWRANGGDGGTITLYRESLLLIRAPDYMQRQLEGYPAWPRSMERTAERRESAAQRTERRIAERVERERRAAERAGAAGEAEPAASDDQADGGEPDVSDESPPSGDPE